MKAKSFESDNFNKLIEQLNGFFSKNQFIDVISTSHASTIIESSQGSTHLMSKKVKYSAILIYKE